MPDALSPSITPAGALLLSPDPDAPPIVDPAVAARVAAAFARDPWAGLLHLGAVEVSASLPPAFAWLRDFSKSFVARLCAAPELEALRGTVQVAPPPESELARAVDAAPAMRGAEYVDVALLQQWWGSLQGAVADALSAWDGAVEAWLQSRNAAWHRVGRVCLHLAERKGDDARPFAFMATYTVGVSASAKAQHVPLGKALRESAESGDQGRLDALLEPVRRAAATSAVARALVSSGELFHAVSWKPPQALALLKDIPALESAGVMVRVPDWWKPSRPARPTVRVTVGARRATVGADALLDFDVDLALDDEALTPDEVEALREAGSGLVRVKGRWVEVDAARLDAALKQWKAAQRAARDGVSFHEAMRLLAGVGGAAGDVGDDPASSWSRVVPGPWMREVLAALRDPASLGDVSLGASLKATLRPYQQVGVRWLWFLSRLGLGGCLADDMGLGKTIQVISLMLLEQRQRGPGAPPHLLVAPASLLANWRAELARFAPSLRVKTAHPSAGKDAPPDDAKAANAWRADADVVVTSYGFLTRSGWMRDAEWGLAVLDEAQAIKNAETKQSRAARALRARGRFALTGTPVENRLGDLWSIFDFAQPGLLGGAKDFKRFAKELSEGESREGYAPLRRLVGPYILRRLKSDKSVVSDLPDKTEVTAWCALTKAQARLYREAVEDLRAALDATDGDDTKRRGVVLASLMRFKQVCNHPSQWTGDGAFDPSDSGKFARLGEIAEAVAARGEKALVFTQFQEMCGPLEAFLSGVFGASGVVLHGATPVKKRAALVEAFQSDPRVPFFVLSLKAGGTGLNLTAAQHVVHFDRWWNPAVEDQATDRAYRIGQRRNVLVHRFVCRGTLEERIDAMLTEKRAVAGAILDPSGGAERSLTEMSDEELMRVVALDLDRALDAG